MSEPIAAPRNAPLELKLKIMLRNWSYPEFREILYKEAKEGKDHKYSSVYKRLYAYLRTLELSEHDLGLSRIREVMHDEVGFKPPKNTILHWLRGTKTPLRRMSVFDVRVPRVGLVIGLILSDGSKYVSYGYRQRLGGARARFFNTNTGILEEFEGACRELGLSTQKGLKRGVWWLEISSTLLYLLLKRFDEFIVKAPASVQWAFIRGLWLGDGHVGAVVALYNTNLKIINAVSTLLKMHEVKHTIQGPYPPGSLGRKPVYVVYIRNYSRKRFLGLTGLADSPPRL